jgi:hypothetical protein
MSATKSDEMLRQEVRHYWFAHYLAVRLSEDYLRAFHQYLEAREFWRRRHSSPYSEFRFIPGVPRRLDENDHEYRQRVHKDFAERMAGTFYPSNVQGPEDFVLFSHSEVLRTRFGLIDGTLPQPLYIDEVPKDALIEATKEVIDSQNDFESHEGRDKYRKLKAQRDVLEEGSLKLVRDSDEVPQSMTPIVHSRDDRTYFQGVREVIGPEAPKLRFFHLASSNQKLTLDLVNSGCRLFVSPEFPVLVGRTENGVYVDLLAKDEVFGRVVSQQKLAGVSGDNVEDDFETDRAYLPVPHKTRGQSSMRDLAAPVSSMARHAIETGLAAVDLHSQLQLPPVRAEMSSSDARRIIRELIREMAHWYDEKSGNEECDDRMEKFFYSLRVKRHRLKEEGRFQRTVEQIAENSLTEQQKAEYRTILNAFLDETRAKLPSHEVTWKELKHAAWHIKQGEWFEFDANPDSQRRFPAEKRYFGVPLKSEAYGGRNITTSKLLERLTIYMMALHPGIPTGYAQLARTLGLADEPVPDQARYQVKRGENRAREFIQSRDRWGQQNGLVEFPISDKR